MERLLGGSRWIAVCCVITLYLTSVLLIAIGMFNFFYIVHDMIVSLNLHQRLDVILISANVIIIIEVFLEAVIFYILAIGIHKLFIGRLRILRWYYIESLDELRSDLAKTIVIFLAVFLVQKIVGWKEQEKIVSWGIIVCALSAIIIWYILMLGRKNKPRKELLAGQGEAVLKANDHGDEEEAS